MSKFKKYTVILFITLFTIIVGSFLYHSQQEKQQAVEAAKIALEEKKEKERAEKEAEATKRIEARERALNKACPWDGNHWTDDMPEKVRDCRRAYKQARMPFQSIICYSSGVVIHDDPKVFRGIRRSFSTWSYYPDRKSKYYTGRESQISGDCVVIGHEAEIQD